MATVMVELPDDFLEKQLVQMMVEDYLEFKNFTETFDTISEEVPEADQKILESFKTLLGCYYLSPTERDALLLSSSSSTTTPSTEKGV